MTKILCLEDDSQINESQPQSRLITNKMQSFNKFLQYKHNRILVVDDEEFCLVSLRVMLKNLDVNVEEQVDFCINGKEAVSTIKSAYNNGFKYVLILTDFYMPVMNGYQATQQIRDFLKTTNVKEQPSIVGVTGHAGKEYQDKGVKAGMDNVLSKPLYSDDLAKVLEKYSVLS
jgi:CheY-like chemotaxis protein